MKVLPNGTEVLIHGVLGQKNLDPYVIKNVPAIVEGFGANVHTYYSTNRKTGEVRAIKHETQIPLYTLRMKHNIRDIDGNSVLHLPEDKFRVVSIPKQLITDTELQRFYAYLVATFAFTDKEKRDLIDSLLNHLKV